MALGDTAAPRRDTHVCFRICEWSLQNRNVFVMLGSRRSESPEFGVIPVYKGSRRAAVLPAVVVGVELNLHLRGQVSRSPVRLGRIRMRLMLIVSGACSSLGFYMVCVRVLGIRVKGFGFRVWGRLGFRV